MNPIYLQVSAIEKHQEYVDTLENFLEVSSEDIVDIEGILSQFPIYAKPLLEKLKDIGSGRVIDIGAGNGAKAIYLAIKLYQLGIDVTVDAIEPKGEQVKRLIQNYQGENQKYLGNIYETCLSNLQVDSDYDLAIVIHSLYEFPRDVDDTILSLEKLRDLVNARGSGVIITEHPDGDLQKMKRELYPVFGKQAPLSSQMIARTLEKAGIPFRVGITIDFRWDFDSIIDKSELEIGKSLTFLFSNSLNDKPLDNNDYVLIGEWVKKNIRKSEGHWYLWTPDMIFWTFKKAID